MSRGAIAVAAAAAAALLLAAQGPYFALSDDANYLALAEAVRAGKYASPVSPHPVPETQYPPLLPAVCSLVAAPGEPGLPAARCAVAAISLLGMLLAARYLAVRATDAGLLPSLAVAAVFVPAVSYYGVRVLTEGPMLFLAYAALLAVERRRAVPAAAACLAAMYLRQAAWGLFLGLFAWLVLSRRFRQAACFAAVVLLGTLPWWAWQWANGSQYIATHVLRADIYDPASGTIGLSGALSRVVHHLARYAGRTMGEAFFFPVLPLPEAPVRPGDLSGAGRIALSLAATLLLLAGAWSVLDRSGLSAEDCFVLATFAMLLFHPVYDMRYLVPFLPALAFRFLAGLRALAPRLVPAVLAAWAVGFVVLAARPADPGEASFVEVARRVRELPPDAVVVSAKPAGVYLYGRRPGFSYPPSPSGRDLVAAMRAGNARYLLGDRLPGSPSSWKRYLAPALSEVRDLFRPVAVSSRDPEVALFVLAAP